MSTRPSVVKPLSDAAEPMCAQDCSDDDVDGTENLNHELGEKPRAWRGRTLTVAISVLAIAGTATCLKLLQGGQSHSMSETGSQNAIAEWLKLPVWRPAHKTAPLREALDRSESVGVKAISSKAAAMAHEAQAEAAAGKAIEQIADHDHKFIDTLQQQAVARKDLAASLTSQAREMKASAANNMTSAKVMNHTAQLEASTAQMIEKQAESSIVNAEKMKTSSKGVQVVEDLVRKQEQVAEASKTQADSQMEAAKAMMHKSAALMEQAQRDVAAASTIGKEGTAELAMAKAVTKQVELALWHAKNATELAKSMHEDAYKHQKDAKQGKEVANSTHYDYMDADSKIARANAEIEESTRQGEVAHKDLQKAIADNKTALAYEAAAKDVLKALDAQKEAIRKMQAESGEMKNSQAMKDLAETEFDNVESGNKKAQEDIAYAKELAEKAAEKKSHAEQEKSASRAIKDSAQEHKSDAIKVKSDIDSEAQVAKYGIQEIMALKGAGEQDTLAAKTLQKAKEKMLASVKAEKDMANAEIARASALKGAASQATPVGAQAIEQTMEKMVAAANSLQNSVAAAQAADPGPTEMEAGQAVTAAIARENQMLKETADRRVCMHLPGVQLQPAGEENEFPRIVGHEPAGTHAECAAKCQNHAGCKQVIFSYSTGCSLYAGSTYQVANFHENYNSTYCSEVAEKKALLDLIHKAYAQKPFIPEPVDCSWAGDDCSQTKCCNNFKCKWDFSECGGYSCYKRDAGFSGCNYGEAPAGWDGYKLGGPRPLREIPKAQEPWLLQGTSLFCFSAVMWNKPATKKFYDPEAELANNWKSKGLGIMQCDESLILAGEDAPPSSWGSVSNIDAFIHTWEKVRQDGRYKNHDWTVKVDTDAVFFPDRLKMHLDQLRTPRGAKVYLKNVDFRFQFMGALEVLTTEALDTYYLNADLCSRKQGHEGGEDFYMMTCLNGIGVDHQTDFKLLRDKYAAQNSCSDGWAAAFHFYKAVDKWNACHQEAVAAR